MAKGKSKTDFKQLLLKKGEYIAMGLAGVLLVIFLGWGISHWAGKDDPDKISKELTTKAQAVSAKINSTELSEEDIKLGALPEWLKKESKFDQVSVRDFPLTTPPFDVTGKPDTKRENPVVLGLGNYQVDLIRVPMRGYDIVYTKGDEEPLIAMITSKTVTEQDKEKRLSVGRPLKDKAKRGQESFTRLGGPGGGMLPGGGQPPGGGLPGPMGGVPGPMGGLPGSGGGPPGGGGKPGAMGPGGFGSFGGPGFGGMTGGGFDGTAKRDEKVIKYVSLEQYDSAVEKDGMVPAMTVIPLRMVTIHAEVNLKQQLEEIKRALRLPNLDEARKWGPMFDGYEVKRRVSRIAANGTVDEIQPWAEYKFEDRYAELINSRKLADQIEDGYLAHFIRYDMNLALPLPQLVDELGSYPKLTLPAINKTISDMEKAKKPKVSPSALKNRLEGSKNDLYKPQMGDSANKLFGEGTVPSFPGLGKPPVGGGIRPPGDTLPASGSSGGTFKPGDAGNQANAPPIDIDHLLLRFVDVDVKPGLTYEYQIRLRMQNPNFGREKDVSNPANANIKELFSPWTVLRQSVTIPTESFVFAADPAAYRKKIEDEYKDQKELQDRLLWKPYQNMAVVEMCTWMEDVKIDAAGTRREPVGAWVVADMPVGRGEYVGRKTYLKLPLWSSETNQYVLREVQDKILAKVGGKEVPQPKGWLVDFSTRSVLVDFEGGKVSTKPASGRSFTEEAATEMLIALPNGSLMVKKSLEDESNKLRTTFVAAWEKWIKAVETRKSTGEGGNNPFDKKDRPNN